MAEDPEVQHIGYLLCISDVRIRSKPLQNCFNVALGILASKFEILYQYMYENFQEKDFNIEKQPLRPTAEKYYVKYFGKLFFP